MFPYRDPPLLSNSSWLLGDPMLEITTNLNRQFFPVFFTSQSNPLVFSHISNSFTLKKCIRSPCYRSVSCSPYKKFIKVSAARKQDQHPQLEPQKGEWSGSEGVDLGWLPSFPHVLVASMSNFLFGYHIGVMNGPIVSVARELGFEGNSFLEGLVVSIFIVGAFFGSISSGSVVDKLGCRRTFQVDTIPLILGAIVR